MKNPRPSARCFGVERVGRGHAKTASYHNRKSGVFVVAVAEFYSVRKDWHQDDRAVPLIRQYQTAVDAVLRDRPDLAKCAVACCHCGIRFLTHPRNGERRDLRCPFGCRQHQRRQLANARSRKYSRTARGARNKKRLNGRRSQFMREREPSPAGCAASRVDRSLRTEAVALARDSAGEEPSLPLAGFVLQERTLKRTCTLSYLAMLISVLEHAPIRRRDVLPLLLCAMRRRSMGRIARREYVLRYLHEHPPPGDHDEPIGGTNEP